MTLSMYQASVPVFVARLQALAKILAKAEVDAAERKIDPAVFLNTRLAPDMLPLIKQVQIATDHAKGAPSRLSGNDAPRYEDTEATFAELRARIAKTVDLLTAFQPAEIDGSEDRAIEIKVGQNQMSFTGQQYLLHFAMPNFYFHVTTAYAILRQLGVSIGKRDFMGVA